MNPKQILLGRNAATGRRIFVTDQQRESHMFVTGRTRVGKSTFLEFLMRQDIRNGNGICLLDPDGELYNDVLIYAGNRRSVWDRVVLIDPNEEKYRFGLNYFDIPGISPQKRVDLFIEACYKVLGQATDQAKVLFERWGDAAAKPLALFSDVSETALTLAELHPILTNEDFRRAVVSRLPEHSFAFREWEHFAQELGRQDRNMALLAVLDRAAKFVRDERMEEILGQPTRIDWKSAMDEGRIVLVNLLNGPNVTAHLSRMLGVMVIHQIVHAAMLRPKSPPPKPFYVYVDEFGSVVTEDFRTALKRLAKRGVAFTLAQQDLHDLYLQDEGKLYNSIIGNTTNKVAFGMENAEEAATVAEYLFASEATGERIKWQGPPTTQAIPIPRKEEVTDRTYSSSSSRSHTDSSNSSDSTSTPSEGDEIVTTRGVVLGNSSGFQDSDGYSESTHTVRWTDYEYQQIEQAPQFMSVDEELHHFRRRILRQGRGEAQLKYDPKKPTVAIKTYAPGSLDFPKLTLSEDELERFKENVYRNTGLLTPEQVRALIAARHEAILALAPPTPEPKRSSRRRALPTPDRVSAEDLPPAAEPPTSVQVPREQQPRSRKPQGRSSRSGPTSRTRRGPNAL
jgi:hypothetical protein